MVQNVSLTLNAKPSYVSVYEVSFIRRTSWLLNMFYNQVLAIFTVVILWIFFAGFDISDLFLWHVLLSTIAYVPLMAAAIILFSEDNMVTMYIQRTKRYRIHGVLLMISFIAVTVGIGVEVHNKSNDGETHFTSVHATYGLVSWIIVFVAVIIGAAAANTKTFTAFIRPVVVKFMHNFLGIAGFLLGIAALGRGLNIVEMQTNTNIYTAFRFALGFITIWSVLVALKSLWGQFRNIISSS